MDKEARRIIEIFNDKDKSVDFTMYVERLKVSQPILADKIIEILKTGEFEVRYLNSTGV